MTEIYLMSNKKRIYIAYKVGSSINLTEAYENIEDALVVVTDDIENRNINEYTIYSTDIDFLNMHGNKGLNLRYGSIDDKKMEVDLNENK